MNGMLLRADFLQPARHVDRHLFGFDDTGARDQEKRLVEPDFEIAQFHAFSPTATGVRAS